jgi:endonuclease YncB( thermonuclease family)
MNPLPLLLALAVCGTAQAADLSGHPVVHDGDTLFFGETHVRLWGVDSPELAQSCTKPGASLTITYACGVEARDALIAWIASREVVCAPTGSKTHGRPVAACAVGGADVGAWLVTNGHAWAATRYSGAEYTDEEATARGAKLGIWQGEAVPAWIWRKQR